MAATTCMGQVPAPIRAEDLNTSVLGRTITVTDHRLTATGTITRLTIDAELENVHRSWPSGRIVLGRKEASVVITLDCKHELHVSIDAAVVIEPPTESTPA
ncbi:hypothetical protein ACFWHR_03945 [Leucobacter sp. NPDC058333]|uniref:hypothetical protein n=1 Tax=Leucobacter sp. NPDC058333 TaxID=3346450 RepID=UPI0036540652